MRYRLPDELRKAITQHQEMLRTGIAFMEARFNFYKKRDLTNQKHLSDLEIDEFLAIVKSEIMLVPIDAFCADAFLQREDERRAKMPKWKRALRAWRKPHRTLADDYRRFTDAMKAALYPRGQGIGMKEEIDEEGAAAARAAIQAHRERPVHAGDGSGDERVEAGGPGVADPDLGGRGPVDPKTPLDTSRS